jgi:protein-S-isoprenylcysteine O-methyltransferase Ste14
VILLTVALIIPVVVVLVTSRITVGGCQEFALEKPIMEVMVAVILLCTDFVMLLYILGHLAPQSRKHRMKFRNDSRCSHKLITALTIGTVVIFAFAVGLGHSQAANAYRLCKGKITLKERKDNGVIKDRLYNGVTAKADILYNYAVVIFVLLSAVIYCWCEIWENAYTRWTKLVFFLMAASTGLIATITFGNELSESSTLFSWYAECPKEIHQKPPSDKDCKNALEDVNSSNSVYFPLTMEFCFVALPKLYYLLSTGTTEDDGTDVQTGSTQTGSTQTGSTQTGSTQTGSTQTGSTQTGSTQTGSTQ